jgi:hypothetical protein
MERIDMEERSTTGFLINSSNQMDARSYVAFGATATAVPEFTDGMGWTIRCTEDNQLLLDVGPFDGKNLSKHMAFLLVWTDNIPEGIDDHIIIKHLVDGVEDTDDTMTITKSNLSVVHGDVMPYYFYPGAEHRIQVFATANAVGYDLSFDYIQFNTMSVNQVNSATIASTPSKALTTTLDSLSTTLEFSNDTEKSVTLSFNTEFIEPPNVHIQPYSSYFMIDIMDVSTTGISLDITTNDGAAFTGPLTLDIMLIGVTEVPYVTRLEEYMPE